MSSTSSLMPKFYAETADGERGLLLFVVIDGAKRLSAAATMMVPAWLQPGMQVGVRTVSVRGAALGTPGDSLSRLATPRMVPVMLAAGEKATYAVDDVQREEVIWGEHLGVVRLTSLCPEARRRHREAADEEGRQSLWLRHTGNKQSLGWRYHDAGRP